MKYIVVYRNPRDVAVSLFHHLNAFKYVPNKWNSFAEKFLTGDVIYGSYFKHLSGWLDQRGIRLFFKVWFYNSSLLRFFHNRFTKCAGP